MAEQAPPEQPATRFYLEDGTFYDKPRMSALLLYTVYVDDEESSGAIENIGVQPLPSVCTTFAPKSASDVDFMTAELYLFEDEAKWNENYKKVIGNDFVHKHSIVLLIDAPAKFAALWTEAWKQFPFTNLVVVAVQEKYESFGTVVMNDLSNPTLLDRALKRVKRHYRLRKVDAYSPPIVEAKSAEKPLFIYYSKNQIKNKLKIKKEIFKSLGETNPNVAFVDSVSSPFKNVPGEPQADFLTNLFDSYLAVIHITHSAGEKAPFLRFGVKGKDLVCNLNEPVQTKAVVGKLLKLRLQKLKPFQAPVFKKPRLF